MRGLKSCPTPAGAAGLALLLLAAATGCKQSGSGDGAADIDAPPLGELDPSAERPVVVFPPALQRGDPEVNQFIRDALEICAKGDYDGFRGLFGLNYRPPPEMQFQRVWRGVKQVTVANILSDPRKPDEYYIHVVIQLRRPNRQNQTERQAVVWLYKEGKEWRLGTAPSEITRRIMAAASRPADEAEESSTADDGRSPATAPATESDERQP